MSAMESVTPVQKRVIVNLSLDRSLYLTLRDSAEERRVSTAALILKMLVAIAADDLVDAILDDGKRAA